MLNDSHSQSWSRGNAGSISEQNALEIKDLEYCLQFELGLSVVVDDIILRHYMKRFGQTAHTNTHTHTHTRQTKQLIDTRTN